MYVVDGSIQERADNKLYNMAAAYDYLGQMVAKYRKMHLVDIDILEGSPLESSIAMSSQRARCSHRRE